MLSGDNQSQVTQELLARDCTLGAHFQPKEHEAELEGWLTGSVRSTNPCPSRNEHLRKDRTCFADYWIRSTHYGAWHASGHTQKLLLITEAQ